ncbi:MAG: hypothetical protein ACJ8CB_34975 [Ktedonobacteraceae bacterium]
MAAGGRFWVPISVRTRTQGLTDRCQPGGEGWRTVGLLRAVHRGGDGVEELPPA